ncbi:associated with TFs and helicase family protein, partial [Aphelenchoides avenae]
MNAVVCHGGGASREIIQRYEMYYPKNEKAIYKFDALITTSEMVVTDCEVLNKVNYRVCIIDEPHRLKNRNCKLLTGGLLAFRMEHRVLLTGTPLQNNIQELFSLLNFLEPQQFGNSESFLEQFGQCQTDEQVKKLQDILKPRSSTVEHPEEVISRHSRAYTYLLKGTSAPNLMNAMMELRKCCNHPFLINGAEEQIVSELRCMHPGKSEEELQQISLVQSSGIVVLIDKLLPKLRQDGHKVLIFSQIVKELDLLEEFLVHMNYQFERIDGNVRGDLRQAAIDRFCKPDSERFVFLLCTRAGGLGINLTAADTVIIFDSDWNPQNDLQAQARCHRIGQTKMVKVYRHITANTYERDPSTAMKDSGNQLTHKEVEDLLKKVAYGAVMDEDNEGSKFSEEDIEIILQTRTQTNRLEAPRSFTSSSNREDIDANDPNFWAKWAKKANIEVNTVPEEILHELRSRRKRFEENYKGLNEGESEEGDGSDNDSGGGGRGDKTRSAKKRRREDDDGYVSYNVPNEFAFNKSEYFK